MPDPQAQPAATGPDVLPTSGGSYIRQPDGSLLRTDIDTTPATPADQAGNSTPDQE